MCINITQKKLIHFMGCRSLQVPRPHISVAWALGDISNPLKKVFEGERRRSAVGKSLQKSIFTSKFNGIECRVGNKIHKICKFSEE